MQRIIDPSAAASLPAPPALTGTTGYFTEGSPGITAATKVRGWWVNMMQEELLALLTAAGISPDTTATNFTQVLAAIKIVATGRLLNVQTFLASGTYTPFTGMKNVIFEAQGGGGGGGGTGSTGASSSAAGGAGGSGAYAKGMFSAASIGASQVVTIGAAGAGNSSANGGVGGLSSVGSLIIAPGGLGGIVGTAVSSFPTSTAGGSGGGAPTGGNIEAIVGIAGIYGLVLALSASVPGYPFPSRMGSYGMGGAGSNAGASAAATAGSPGVIGKVIGWEFS